jgi:hypothetical protein
MVKALGVREWVGLALLAVAMAISFTFLDAGARGDVLPRTPDVGVILPTPSAESSPSPTQPPPNEVEVPAGSWFVEYYDRESEVANVQDFIEELDIEHDGAPFGDFANDDWRMTARTEIELEPGGQVFTLSHDGSVRVLVDGNEVASDSDPIAGERELVVLFQHAGGLATILIEASDVEGAFVLRWQ